MKNPGFYLLLLTTWGLWAQEIPEIKIFSPYVSNLEVQQSGNKIVITWSDSPDLTDVNYEVYRNTQEINKDTLSSSLKIATIPSGKGWAEETPQESGQYYYAVIAVDDKGKAWTQYHPYQNKSIIPLNYILGTTTPLVVEKPQPAAPPVTIPPVATPPVTSTPMTPPTTTTPPPPLTTVPPTSTPTLTQALTFDIQPEAARSLALPYRIIDQGPSDTPSSPDALQEETKKILSSLLKVGDNGTKDLPVLEVLPDDQRTANLIPAGDKELVDLVNKYFIKKSWAEGAKSFELYSQKERDKKRQAKGYFYAGQCFLMANNSKKALMNFILAGAEVPNARTWSDFLLTPGVMDLPLSQLISPKIKEKPLPPIVPAVPTAPGIAGTPGTSVTPVTPGSPVTSTATGDIMVMTFSPDGKKLYLGTQDGRIRIYDPLTRKDTQTVLAHGERITDLKISPDGLWLVSASWDHTIKIWNGETGVLKYTFEGHPQKVEALDVSPDGKWLVSGGEDSVLKLWNLETGTLESSSEKLGAPIKTLAFAGNSQSVLARDEEGTLFLWNITTGVTTRGQFPEKLNAPSQFTWEPTRNMIFESNGGNGKLNLIDLETLETYITLQPTTGTFVARPNIPSQQLLSIEEGQNQETSRLRITRLGGRGGILKEFPLGMKADLALFSPGDPLIALSSGNKIYILDGETGENLTLRSE